MRIKQTTVFQFDELSDEAKARARDWYREGCLDYDWHESTYDDAERAGLEITEFDLSHRTIRGKLTTSFADSLTRILNDHGKDCDTYKLALDYQSQLQAARKVIEAQGEEFDESYDVRELEEEYVQRLCEEYLSILDKELEYQLSEECVDESIRANEYEFLETGKRA